MSDDTQKSKNYNEIINRLDVLIGLLFDLVNKGETRKEGEQIYKLKRLGLDINGIAKIIGKSKEKISKQLYKMKTKKIK